MRDGNKEDWHGYMAANGPVAWWIENQTVNLLLLPVSFSRRRRNFPPQRAVARVSSRRVMTGRISRREEQSSRKVSRLNIRRARIKSLTDIYVFFHCQETTAPKRFVFNLFDNPEYIALARKTNDDRIIRYSLLKVVSRATKPLTYSRFFKVHNFLEM